MALHKKFFFLLVALIPVQLGYHLWPTWSYVLGRQIDYLSPTLYLTDIITFLVVASAFFSGVFRKTNTRKFFWSAFSVCVFVFLNVFVSVNRPAAFYGWVKFSEFLLLFWYMIRAKPGFRGITNALAVGVLYSSFLAIWQFFLGHSVGGIFWWFGERTFDLATPGIARVSVCLPFGNAGCFDRLRAYATFAHPNVFGGFLAVALPLILYSFRRRVNDRNILLAFSFVCGTVALTFSFSRSAWALFAAGVFVTVYVRARKKTPVVVSGILVFLIALVAVFLSVHAADLSVVRRVELNAAAVTIFLHHPLFGAGLNNFLELLPQTSAFRTIYFLQPVHNIYLLVLCQVGLVGTVSIAAVCVYAWKYRRKNMRWSIRYYPFIVMLLVGVIDHYPLTLQQGQLLFVVSAGLFFLPEAS